jgi:predicted secreted protein
MASDQKLREFKQELWDLIMDYAPEESDSSDKFMVAGALLATTLEIYVLTMGKESTIHIVEHAIESVREDSYKRKLH